MTSKLRDQYGRFVARDPALRPPVIPPRRDSRGRILPHVKPAPKPRTPPARDARGRFISAKLVPPSRIKAILDRLDRANRDGSSVYTDRHIRQAIAYLGLIEAQAARKIKHAEMAEIAAERAEYVANVIADIRAGRVKKYSREELVNAFGIDYDVDPHEFIQHILY